METDSIKMLTCDMVRDYLEQFYQPIDEEFGALRNMAEPEYIPIIMQETEGFLKLLLKLEKPVKILEIGTAIGYSAMFFANQRPDASVYTIEKDPEMYKAAESNIKRMGYSENIKQFIGDGQEVVEELYNKGLRDVDFVFIDAAKSHYARFLHSILKVCADGAMIVSDNIFQKGMTINTDLDVKNKHRTSIKRMNSYVRELKESDCLDSTLLASGDGLAISIYRKEN